MSEFRPQELTVRTPEGISFALKLAGPGARMMAWLVDQVIVWGLLTALSVVAMLFAWIGPGYVMAAMLIAYFAIDLFYGVLLEWGMRGQTLGKRMLRLRVMDEQALRLRFHQVMIRNLLRFVDRFPFFYLVGGVAMFFSRRAQRLGDFAAGTIVIHEPKLAQPALDRVLADKYNSFREYPHIAARLRSRVAPAEAQIALEALLRRDTLELEARIELFQKLAEHFRELAPFPQSATDGLPDEQYVRNVVDTLYRK